jgi:dihydroflavonol-4-reductase
MKALVLGASGLLGANLVRALVAQGDEVRAFLRPSSQARTLEGIPVRQVRGDLGDLNSLTRACEGVQVVYQAAAYYPPQTVPVDLATSQALSQTKNLLDAVRQTAASRLVFGSSFTTIGFPREHNRLADETCPFATVYRDNPYLAAKIAMEEAVLRAAQEGVPAVVVNPGNFFGPYDSRPSSGTLILMIAKRQMLGYIQGPVNVIDVRDVAVGMIRAAARGRIGERYILGNWNTTQKDLNELIAREAGVSAPLFPVPFQLARYGSKLGDWAFRSILGKPAPIPGFFVEMLRHAQQYDCSKAIHELDYPRSPVEGAIRDALAWFRANGYLRA